MGEVNNTSLIQEVKESKTEKNIKEYTIRMLKDADAIMNKVKTSGNESLIKKFEKEYADVKNATILALREENKNIKEQLTRIKGELVINRSESNGKIDNTEKGTIIEQKVQLDKMRNSLNQAAIKEPDTNKESIFSKISHSATKIVYAASDIIGNNYGKVAKELKNTPDLSKIKNLEAKLKILESNDLQDSSLQDKLLLFFEKNPNFNEKIMKKYATIIAQGSPDKFFNENKTLKKGHIYELGRNTTEIKERLLEIFKNKDIHDMSIEEKKQALAYLHTHYKDYVEGVFAGSDENTIAELVDKKDVNVFQERLIADIITNEGGFMLFNNDKGNYISNSTELIKEIKGREISQINTETLRIYLKGVDKETINGDIKNKLIVHIIENTDSEFKQLMLDKKLITTDEIRKFSVNYTKLTRSDIKEVIKLTTDEAYNNYFKENKFGDIINKKGDKEYIKGIIGQVKNITDKEVLIKVLNEAKQLKDINIKLENINETLLNKIEIVKKFNLTSNDINLLDKSFIKQNINTLINITENQYIRDLIIKSTLDTNKIDTNKIDTNKIEIINLIKVNSENSADSTSAKVLYDKLTSEKDNDLTTQEYILLDNYFSKYQNKKYIEKLINVFVEDEVGLGTLSQLPKLKHLLLSNDDYINILLDKDISFVKMLDKSQMLKYNKKLIQKIKMPDDKQYLLEIELNGNNITDSLDILDKIKDKVGGKEELLRLFKETAFKTKLNTFINSIQKDSEIFYNNKHLDLITSIKTTLQTDKEFIDKLNELKNKLKVKHNNINIEKLNSINGIKDEQKVKILEVINGQVSLINPETLKEIFKGISKEQFDKILSFIKIENNKNLDNNKVSKIKKWQERNEKLKKYLKKGEISNEKVFADFETFITKQKALSEKEGKYFDVNKIEVDFGNILKNKGFTYEQIKKFNTYKNSIKTTAHINEIEKTGNEKMQKALKSDSSTKDFIKNLNKAEQVYVQAHIQKIFKEDPNLAKELGYKKNPKTGKYENAEIKALESKNNSSTQPLDDKALTYNTETQSITKTTPDGKTITIKINETEQKNLKNPEYVKNLVNLNTTLQELGVADLWQYRTDIFKAIPDIHVESSNYLSVKEVNKFLQNILKSTNEKYEINSNETLQQIRNDFTKYNNLNLSGNASGDNLNKKGDSRISEIFMERYVKNGIFQIEEFKKHI